MLDVEKLRADVAATIEQARLNITLEGSAADIIDGFAAKVQEAVNAALAAHDVTNQAVIDAIDQSILQVKDEFKASSDKLGAAVVANTTPPTP